MNMNSENIKSVFEFFCDPNDIRGILTTPSFQDGYSYATDAHSLIAIKEDFGFEHRDKPNFRAVIPSEHTWCEPVKINTIQLIDKLRSVDNYNIHESIDCEHCDDGSFEYEGLDYQCKHCDGFGEVDGKILKFNKTHSKEYSLTVNPNTLYLSARILWAWCVASEKLGIYDWDIVHFQPRLPVVLTSNGILIILMPLTDPQNEVESIDFLLTTSIQ